MKKSTMMKVLKACEIIQRILEWAIIVSVLYVNVTAICNICMGNSVNIATHLTWLLVFLASWTLVSLGGTKLYRWIELKTLSNVIEEDEG